MASPWHVRPEPICGEILSAYLVRCAHSNGMTPYRFMSFHCRGIPVWNRDIDRNATNELIAQVSKGSGVGIDSLTDMTLRSLATRLGSSDATSPAIAPWINAVGIYHRIRRRHGMQYCPHCLTAEGTYKKIWRLAFVTVCPIHQCWLLDGCPHCSAQITYHRNDALHLHCHQCGRSLLSDGFQYDSLVGEVGALLQFQAKLLSLAEHGDCALGGGQSISASTFFAGMSILLSAVKASARADRHRTRQLDPAHGCFPPQRIELLRVAARAQQCRLLAELLEDWPRRFLDLAKRRRLTQRHFPPMSLNWVRHAVGALPEGDSRIRNVTVVPIRRQLRALHRGKCGGWRTERARILLRRALRGI
jgi:TniQ